MMFNDFQGAIMIELHSAASVKYIGAIDFIYWFISRKTALEPYLSSK